MDSHFVERPDIDGNGLGINLIIRQLIKAAVNDRR